jgi:dihydroxyacetone kinase-like predicted kinase
MISSSNEIITLFHGDMVEKERAEKVREVLQERYSDKEVELYFGGQPSGQYIIGIE